MLERLTVFMEVIIMKSLIILATLLASLPIGSTVFANSSEEIFTEVQRQEIVGAIDNICADTWCEGDYNFEFIDFNCNKLDNTCKLSFHFIKTEDNDDQTYSPLQICHFENIKSIKQIKRERDTLTDKFYEEVSDCITDLESELNF